MNPCSIVYLPSVHNLFSEEHEIIFYLIVFKHTKQIGSLMKFPCVCVCVCVRARAHVLSHVRLFFNLMDCSPSGSSIHEICQARILEQVAISFSRGLFPTQGSKPHLLFLLLWQADSLPPKKPPISTALTYRMSPEAFRSMQGLVSNELKIESLAGFLKSL